MRAAEFLPGVRRVLERRGEPAHRLEQAHFALIRDWEEATNLPRRGLRTALAAKDLRGRTAVSLSS
jgi:hypothetical protein